MAETIDTALEDLAAEFELLGDWEERYRYVIELGRELSPLPDAARTDANKVQGCASQVWLQTRVRPDGEAGPVLDFLGDSDAHIVKGLIAIAFRIFSGKSPEEILKIDEKAILTELGLKDHLTPQRSNGFRSMVNRIQRDAQAALATV